MSRVEVKVRVSVRAAQHTEHTANEGPREASKKDRGATWSCLLIWREATAHWQYIRVYVQRFWLLVHNVRAHLLVTVLDLSTSPTPVSSESEDRTAAFSYK